MQNSSCGYQQEGEGEAEGVKEGKYSGCTFYMCMKVEQWSLLKCSKKGGGRWGRMMEGVNLINIHNHICKCHNETPPYN
jgi:hypothetical protein